MTDEDTDNTHDTALGLTSAVAEGYDDGRGFDIEAWAEKAVDEDVAEYIDAE